MSSSPPQRPEHRRWSAMLLGAALLLPAGCIVFLSTPGWERWFGVLLAFFGVYVVAGAFSPRLLLFPGPRIVPTVAVPVVVCAILATIRLAEGRILLGTIWAASGLSIALHARATPNERVRSTDSGSADDRA